MTLEQEIEMLKDQLKRMEEERDHNYDLAVSWMKSYDELKEKYEPMFAVVQND